VTVRVLVVEDEPRVAQAHADYVGRVPGFEVVGIAHSAAEAVRFLQDHGPADLLLLDLHLPDGHGLGLVQRLRAGGELCDVIAVTAARDLAVVRRAVAQGVVLYLLKPFTFSMFRAKLEQYAAYRRRLGTDPDEVVQDQVDQLLDSLRMGATGHAPPKGLSGERLNEVTQRLRATPAGWSASELGDAVGISRVTARRYLEHLADLGMAHRTLRQAGAGRPEVEYQWSRSGEPVSPPR
jgi:response regulator of citrate/malate metabolism